MKILLACAVLAACLFASEARAVQESRILDLLKSIEKQLDRRDTIHDDDWKDHVVRLIEEIDPEILNTPVFEVDHEKLGQVFLQVIQTVSMYAPPELREIGGARFARAYMEVVIHAGMDHVWELASEAYTNIRELDGDEPTKKRKLRTMGHPKNMARRKFVKREADGEDDPFWGAVYSVLAAPNYDLLGKLDDILSPIDEDYYGNFFANFYYMAESDGLLSRSVTDVGVEIAGNLGYALWTPPTGDADGVLQLVLAAIQEWTETIRSLDADELDLSYLDGDDRELVLTIVRSVTPLIEDFVSPVEHMLHLYEEDAYSLGEFFLGVLGRVLEDSYNELREIVPAVREGAELKKDVIENLIEAIKNGKGRKFFVTLFVEVAHAAIGLGADLDGYMEWAGGVLDRVDAILAEEGPAVREVKGMKLGAH